MIAGLPLDTWILVVAATVPPLVVAAAACRVHGRSADGSGAKRPWPGEDAPAAPAGENAGAPAGAPEGPARAP